MYLTDELSNRVKIKNMENDAIGLFAQKCEREANFYPPMESCLCFYKSKSLRAHIDNSVAGEPEMEAGFISNDK